MNSQHFTRREFLRVSSAVGGGLLVAVGLPTPEIWRVAPGRNGAGEQAFTLNAYVEIGRDGGVTVTVPCPEIGQGVRTSLSMIVAEELGADWSTIRVRQAPADERYGGMTVGGSDSVRDYWEPLRIAGATAREMLKAAAAEQWHVESASCRVESGWVVHRPSGQRVGFGDVAPLAAARSVPDEVPLKGVAAFELVGSRVTGVDIPRIVVGAAVYGLDVRRPGMLFAVVERPPVAGARIDTFDASEAQRVQGVRQVVEIAPVVIGGQLYGAVRGGVAVVADNTWAALRGRAALRVRWDMGRYANDGTARLRERFAERAGRPGETVVRDDGDATRQIDNAPRVLDARYELPLLAHVTMEPVNFTADVRADRCTVWGPTQDPRYLHALLRAALRLPADAIEVHPTLAGGGFGRRLAVDYGVEAALVSQAVGAPVQVVWSREDDVRQDYYRTPSHHNLRASLSASGRLTGWYHHVVTASLARHIEVPRGGDEPRPPGLYEVQGAADMPYDLQHLRVEYTPVEIGLQMGSWRSVAHSFNVFAVESFLDEIAAATQADPLQLRLSLLGGDGETQLALPLPGRRGRPRFQRSLLRRVLASAADAAGWGTPLPAGWGRGIACTEYKGTYVAHVAEVSVDEAGAVRVHRIVAAVDAGLIVCPSGAEAQVEGAAMDGVASVFHWEITFGNGRVDQSNFHDYPMLRMGDAPHVDVHLLPSDRAPSGVGEPPYPSAPPAITNAIFSATGIRARRLPVRLPELRRSSGFDSKELR